MAKYSDDKGDDRNINDPGFVDEDNVYRKKNEEESKKIPVEYLHYVQKRRSSQVIRTVVFWIITVILFGFGPGMKGQSICPQCGRIATHVTVTWGHWRFNWPVLKETGWTAWFEAQQPLPHEHHWVHFGKEHPSLFAYVTVPWGVGEDWQMPENLVDRVDELKPMMTPRTRILDIPRILHAVNNKLEWEAIVLPLTIGTPKEALQWWQDNYSFLNDWASQSDGTRLADDFIARSKVYVDSKTPKEINSLLPP